MLGVRKYGADFAAIADVIGNKTASHVRNFFVSYRQRFRLDEMVDDKERGLSSVRHAKITKHTDAQPSEVNASFPSTSCSASFVFIVITYKFIIGLWQPVGWITHT